MTERLRQVGGTTMSEEHQWEVVHEWDKKGQCNCTSRMKVPGGWLYIHINTRPYQSECLVFVPEPQTMGDLLQAIRNVSGHLSKLAE